MQRKHDTVKNNAVKKYCSKKAPAPFWGNRRFFYALAMTSAHEAKKTIKWKTIL